MRNEVVFVTLTDILTKIWDSLSYAARTILDKIGNSPLQMLLQIVLVLAVAEIIGKIMKASKKVVFILLAVALLAYLDVITIPWEDVKAALDGLGQTIQSSSLFSSASH